MTKPATAILSPCFNEGAVVIDFLQSLETVLDTLGQKMLVIMVDDSSEDDTLERLSGFKFKNGHELHVLSLQYNVGHQGAIYQGLLYASTLELSRVIILDSDGEDDPEAIPELLQLKDFNMVEVKRGKRRESAGFQFGYAIYKILFRVVTGKKIEYGNYCMISKSMVDRIANTSFIHLPAYLLKQKGSRTSIIFNRQKRFNGRSKMGAQGLLIHAFKSLLEFGEDLLMVFLKIFLVISVAILVLLSYMLYSKFVSHTAILGWFSTLTVELVNLAMLCFGFFILGILLLNLIHQQNNRQQKNIYRLIK